MTLVKKASGVPSLYRHMGYFFLNSRNKVDAVVLFLSDKTTHVLKCVYIRFIPFQTITEINKIEHT